MTRTQAARIVAHLPGAPNARDEVGNVRARDDENQQRRSEQNPKDSRRALADLVAQQHRVNSALASVEYASGCALTIGRRRLAVRRSPLQRYSGREPTEQLRHTVNAALDHRCREMMRTGHHIGDDFGIRRIGHGRFEHADNRRGAVPSLTVLPRTEGSRFSVVDQKR